MRRAFHPRSAGEKGCRVGSPFQTVHASSLSCFPSNVLEKVESSSVPDPEGRLPEETLGAVDLKKRFSEKGFS